MRKIIGAINITIDGVCDHTVLQPDYEVHQHYTELLNGADTILYGRITYDLMKFWQTFIEKPSGETHMDEFAVAIDKIVKLVFSKNLKNTEWHSTRLATKQLKEEVLELKQQKGKDILVGSRSLIFQLMKLNLLDELQLCVHPVIAGGGLSLFEDVRDRKMFNLVKTKSFNGGAIILYYTI